MEHYAKQNGTNGFYIFADDSAALGTGKTGRTISATLSKNGAAASAVAPTITEIGNGYYWVAPIAAHRDTLGRNLWQFSATDSVIAGRIERIGLVDPELTSWGAMPSYTQPTGFLAATFPTTVASPTNISTVGAVSGNVAGNVNGSVGSVTGSVGSVTGSVGSVTAAVTVGTNNDKTGYALSSAGVQAIWDFLVAGITLANSIGKRIVDNLNATVSSRGTSTLTASQVWSNATRTLSDNTNTNVAAIKAVTDKLDTAMVLDGAVYQFTANALELAPTGGGGGTADWTADEKTVLKAVLGIPASGTAPDTPTTGILATINTNAVAVKAKTDNLPSDPADASVIAGRFDTVDSGITALNLTATGIKTKTDNLPNDPADESNISSRFNTVDATLAAIAGYIDTEVASIKAKTDNLPADPADASDIAARFDALDTAVGGISGGVDVSADVAAIKAKTDLLPGIDWTAVDVTVMEAVLDKLNTTMELSGSNYRFTASALANAPGGAPSVTISPALAVQVQEPYPSTNLEAIANEVDPTKTILIVDQAGASVDMTGKDLIVIFKNADGDRITTTSISIVDNAVTFMIPEDVVNNHGKYTWALRTQTTNIRYAHGFLTVKDVPV